MRVCSTFYFLVLLLMAFPLFPQAGQGLSSDPGTYIGMRLSELINHFGAPVSVHAARGNEAWQDDVIFEYNEGSFYIHRDRVWKVSFNSAYGISLRDSKAAALLVFGSRAEDRGDHFICQLTSSSATVAWPMALRINFNNAGLVSAIFIYRSDF